MAPAINRNPLRCVAGATAAVALTALVTRCGSPGQQGFATHRPLQ
jgi:hypothetical protein